MTLRIAKSQWQQLLAELECVRKNRQLITYRALLDRLDLPTPSMQTLALALEALAAQDKAALRPLRSALVISQGAIALPRPGFFQCVQRLGGFDGDPQGELAQQWHAEQVQQVFETCYPESE